MKLRNSLIALTLACSLTLGCGTFGANVVPVIARVLAVVMDAQQILSVVEKAAEAFFVVMPNEEAKAQYEHHLALAKTALNTIVRIGQGAENLDAERIDKAFDDFKVAYVHLTTLLKTIGVFETPHRLAFRAAKGGGVAAHVDIQDPLALTYRVRK